MWRKTMTPRQPRFRFSLKVVLFLPVLVAAFFGGWISHRRMQQEAYLRDRAASIEFYEQFMRTIAAQRPRPRSIDESMMIIDGMEHRRRVERLQQQRHEP
jgi:hypothetical protein